MREPPFPKSKKIEKKDDTYISAEDTDPVWLKDKGDHFYKRNDFVGAVRAYSKALDADKDIMSAKLNRATTFLKARGFQ
jgi:dyslexia susceptibility 1 candidate gene 1 protein